MRTLRFYFYCMRNLMWKSITLLGKVKKLNKNENYEQLEVIFRKLIKSKTDDIFKIAGVEVETFGDENIPEKGPVVFISNHQGNFDVIALSNKAKRKVGFIAKKELGSIPLLGVWMKMMGCFFVDRSDIRQMAKSINDSINYIKKGNAMVIFPEGTRSRSSEVGQFKKGSFKLAIKSKSAIVPVSMDGSYNIMEANDGKIKPGKIKIKFHKPIQTSSLDKEELNNIHETTRDIIKNGIEELKNETR